MVGFKDIAGWPGYFSLTFSLKVPPDRGLATRSKSENRKRCLGLAFTVS